MKKEELLREVKFDENGLIPVIAQDYHSKKVRMLAYMNKEALEKTLSTGQVHYYSRSRKSLWLKGDTSGYYQYLKAIAVDCDNDTLLIQIEQVGGISCHTGNATCFYREITDNQDYIIETKRELSKENMLVKLYNVITERKLNPKEGSYTNYLFNNGVDKILKKIGEETTEVIIASKSDKKADVVFEIADLMYHLSVLMASLDITWEDIEEELDKR